MMKALALFRQLMENKLLGKEFPITKLLNPLGIYAFQKSSKQRIFSLHLKMEKTPGHSMGRLIISIWTPTFSFRRRCSQAHLITGIKVKNLAQMYVYRDGFGVRMGKDWLNLAGAWTSAASYYSLKPSNVIGFFRLSVGDNPQLIEKSDREGFTDNESWRGFSTLALVITSSINGFLDCLRRSASRFLNEATGLHATEEESKTNYGALLDQLEGLLGASEAISKHFDQHAKSRNLGLSQVAAAARVVLLNLKDTVDPRTKAKQLLELVGRLQTDLDADNSQIEKLTKDLIGQKKLAAIIRRRIDDFEDRFSFCMRWLESVCLHKLWPMMCRLCLISSEIKLKP